MYPPLKVVLLGRCLMRTIADATLTNDWRLTTFIATTAAAHINCNTAICSLTSAAQTANSARGRHTGSSRRFAPFQRRPPSLPPTQIVNSAVVREPPARHFGGILCRKCEI